MSKQSLLRALQSVENMHRYMAEERTQTIITDIRASIENSTTLRDQFAMAAISPLLTGAVLPTKEDRDKWLPMMAEIAYEVADTMIQARQP